MSHFFSYAFRPLFTFAIVYALVAVPWWALVWSGYVPKPGHWSSPVLWHAHEMIFGFAGAAIGGFALTAVANWTGRSPVAGLPLQVLCALWLLARFAALVSAPSSLMVAAAADVSYGLLLCSLFARELIAANNRRNFKLMLPLMLFVFANASFYYAEWQQQLWARSTVLAGIFVLILLISIIGGRIVPAFTYNWLARRSREQNSSTPLPMPGFGKVDLFAVLATLVFSVCFLIDNQSPMSLISGVLAAIGQAVRLVRWRGSATLASPLVWMLHLAYLWIPVGLGLLAVSAAGVISASAGLHALTTGAISGMILAVSSRAALGHTNRALDDHPLLTASYIGINVAALIRVVASMPGVDGLYLQLAAICWLFSLSCFALRYLPILLSRSQAP